jgi:glycosyltransferase involved in cell wall biosynthesis
MALYGEREVRRKGEAVQTAGGSWHEVSQPVRGRQSRADGEVGPRTEGTFPSNDGTEIDAGSGPQHAHLPDAAVAYATSHNGNQEASVEMPRVSVVIPAINEARNLPHVLADLPADVFEVVLVDGRSTDGTAEVARAHYPTVRIVGQHGRGKGDALASGFAAAQGDIIVMLDADGSADPAEIPRFVEALRSGADFAKGSRFADGGGSSDITVVRTLGNRLLVWLVNVLYRTDYSDLCYGYNAFWSHCLERINVDCNGFEVETLINIRVAKAKLRVIEVPSFERDRLFGESNLRTFRDGFRVLKTIMRERFRKPNEVELVTTPAGLN